MNPKLKEIAIKAYQQASTDLEAQKRELASERLEQVKELGEVLLEECSRLIERSVFSLLNFQTKHEVDDKKLIVWLESLLPSASPEQTSSLVALFDETENSPAEVCEPNTKILFVLHYAEEGENSSVKFSRPMSGKNWTETLLIALGEHIERINKEVLAIAQLNNEKESKQQKARVSKQIQSQIDSALDLNLFWGKDNIQKLYVWEVFVASGVQKIKKILSITSPGEYDDKRKIYDVVTEEYVYFESCSGCVSEKTVCDSDSFFSLFPLFPCHNTATIEIVGAHRENGAWVFGGNEQIEVPWFPEWAIEKFSLPTPPASLSVCEVIEEERSINR